MNKSIEESTKSNLKYEYDAQEITELTRRLNQNLDKNEISTRSAYAGSKG